MAIQKMGENKFFPRRDSNHGPLGQTTSAITNSILGVNQQYIIFDRLIVNKYHILIKIWS
jgi:hypothetical protein